MLKFQHLRQGKNRAGKQKVDHNLDSKNPQPLCTGKSCTFGGDVTKITVNVKSKHSISEKICSLKPKLVPKHVPVKWILDSF